MSPSDPTGTVRLSGERRNSRAGIRRSWTRHPKIWAVFRVWSIPGRGVGLTQDLPFKEQAVAARAEWDAIDNPITRCEQPGMPMVMLQPGPFRLLRAGDDIILHSPYFDTQRIMHMDGSLDPAEQPASPLGVSMGRWDGNTLTATTTRIDWPYFDGQGTPQSPAVEVTERFTLSNDQTELAFHMTVVDPVTFDGIATREWHNLALGEPFFVVGMQRFLNIPGRYSAWKSAN